MAIYVDTAIIAEAKVASKFGWLAGITTNPTLLAKSDVSPEETLKQLAQLIPGEIYDQLVASEAERLYGSRSKKNKKLIDGMTQAIKEVERCC